MKDRRRLRDTLCSKCATVRKWSHLHLSMENNSQLGVWRSWFKIAFFEEVVPLFLFIISKPRHDPPLLSENPGEIPERI